MDMCIDISEELHELPAMDQDMEDNCGSSDPMLIDEPMLNMENTCSKAETGSLPAIAKRDLGKAPASTDLPASTLNQNFLDPRAVFDIPGDIGSVHQFFKSQNVPIQVDRFSMFELVVIPAVQELDALARMGEPLWIQDIEGNIKELNKAVYFEKFEGESTSSLVGIQSKSSREYAFVMMNPLNILEIFLKLDKWLEVFSGIISQAALLAVLSIGEPENYDGAVQMIAAEFHAVAPDIPARDCIFLRCCKQLREGTWVLVDVSIDALLQKGPIATCRRRPSGFLIEAMPNGYSKITWIEHVEIQELFILNSSISTNSSDYAYGAKRWISILKQECEHLASVQGLTNCEDLNEIVLQNPEGKNSVLRLAERMVSSLFGQVNASSDAYHWTHVDEDGGDEVRFMSKKSVDVSGSSSDFIIGASKLFWIPVLPKVVFDYLCDTSTRNVWDIHVDESIIEEIAYFGKGPEKDNCVTILQVKDANTNEGDRVIVQEANSNTTTSFIVSAIIDVACVDFLFGGGNPDMVGTLPFGFTIMPSKLPSCLGGVDDDRTTDGTLLSFAVQYQPTATCYKGYDALENFVNETISMVKIGLGVAD